MEEIVTVYILQVEFLFQEEVPSFGIRRSIEGVATVVASATAEAEYRAAVSSIDDICWIRRIGMELGILKKNDPTKLFVDNQSAIHMLRNVYEGKITKEKKHIEIPRKFIQQHIGTTVELQHIKSSEQLADILTKPLNRVIFEKLRQNMIKEEC